MVREYPVLKLGHIKQIATLISTYPDLGALLLGPLLSRKSNPTVFLLKSQSL